MVRLQLLCVGKRGCDAWGCCNESGGVAVVRGGDCGCVEVIAWGCNGEEGAVCVKGEVLRERDGLRLQGLRLQGLRLPPLG
jgi:hypothetical protein